MDHGKGNSNTPTRVMAGFVLASWSACLFFLLNGQRYTAFLRPGFGILLTVGLAGLLLLLWGVFQRREEQNVRMLTALLRTGLLLIPLVYMMTARNKVLDEYAFEKRLVTRAVTDPSALEKAQGVASDEQLARGYAASPPKIPDTVLRSLGITPPKRVKKPVTQKKNEVTEVKLTDLAEHADALKGKRVSTEGMVGFLEGMEPNQFYVFRFLIWCCTSDAIPVPILVEYDRAKELKSNSWVRVTATPHIIEGDYDQEVVVLRNAKVEAIERPEDPYLY